MVRLRLAYLFLVLLAVSAAGQMISRTKWNQTIRSLAQLKSIHKAALQTRRFGHVNRRPHGSRMEQIASGKPRPISATLGFLPPFTLHRPLQSGSPWPKFHADDLNNGLGVAGGSNGVLLWQAQSNAAIESSAAIAEDGTIYVGSFDDNLYALNPDGSVKWTFPTGNIVYSSPAIGSDGTVYFGSYDGNLYAVNPDGTQKWAYNDPDHPDPSNPSALAPFDASPALGSNSTVYIGSLNGYFYAINEADGSLQWMESTGAQIYNSSPAVAGDGTIYTGTDNDELIAYNANGTTKWTATTGNPVETSPAVGSDGTVYVASSADGTLYALNPTNGSVTWSSAIGVPIYSSPAVASNGTVYVGGDDGNLYAVASGGTVLWTFTTLAPVESSPAIGTDGTIYVGSQDGNLYAISSSGSLLWAQLTGNVVNSSPAIGADGTVYIGSDDTFEYAVNNPNSTVPISSVTISPSSVPGGTTATGTVTLTGPAPTQGDLVYLFSEDSQATVPASVTVPSGQSSASFTIDTVAVDLDANFNIDATSDGQTVSTPFTVAAPALTGLTLAPSTVVGGYSSVGTVTLSGPAPADGWTVGISVDNTAHVSAPASVTVSAGSTSASFTVTTNALPAVAYTDAISATDVNSNTATATLTISGEKLVSLVLSPSTIGGSDTSTATITVTSPAPAGGWPVNIAVGVPSYVTVPSTVTVPAGAATTTFGITGTGQHVGSLTMGVHATDEASGASASLTIQGDTISTMTLNPTSIGGLGTTTGTVTLFGAAPPGGWIVKLKAGAPGYFSIPSSITIPGGSTTGTFLAIGTGQRSATATVGIVANDSTTSRESLLTIVGDQVIGLSLSPSSVAPGSGSTGTVTLKTAAPNGGWVVHLEVGAPSLVGVPASVTVPVGQTSVTFPITTNKFSKATGVIVIGNDGTSQVSAILTIT